MSAEQLEGDKMADEDKATTQRCHSTVVHRLSHVIGGLRRPLAVPLGQLVCSYSSGSQKFCLTGGKGASKQKTKQKTQGPIKANTFNSALAKHVLLQCRSNKS